MDFEIRKNGKAQGPKPLVRERAAYFQLMEQGHSTREAARIVGIDRPARGRLRRSEVAQRVDGLIWKSANGAAVLPAHSRSSRLSARR